MEGEVLDFSNAQQLTEKLKFDKETRESIIHVTQNQKARQTYTEQNQDQLIIANNRDTTLKLLSNRFKLIAIFHVLIIMCFAFSLSFNEWYKLSNSNDSYIVQDNKYVWLNTLYVYDQNKYGYISFPKYRQSELYYCNTNSYCNCEPSSSKFCIKDLCEACESAINHFEIIGYFCFSSIASSIVLQVIDLARLQQYTVSKKSRQRKNYLKFLTPIKAKFLHPVTFCLQSMGVLGYFILLIIYDSKIGIWRNGTFGAGYWCAWSSCPMYILIQVIYRKNKCELLKMELLDQLLQAFEQELYNPPSSSRKMKQKQQSLQGSASNSPGSDIILQNMSTISSHRDESDLISSNLNRLIIESNVSSGQKENKQNDNNNIRQKELTSSSDCTFYTIKGSFDQRFLNDFEEENNKYVIEMKNMIEKEAKI